MSISLCSTILAERNLFTVFIRRKTQVLMLLNSVTEISYEAWRTLFVLANLVCWKMLERNWTRH